MTIKFDKVRKSRHLTSRYRHSYRFVDKNEKYVLETYERLHVRSHSDDIYHEIRSGEENSLDLIAFKYYKNENMWWVIAEANNIVNPFYIETGKLLRIPSYNNLRGFEGLLV